LVFVDANEDSVMANNVVTPSNPLVTPVEKEKIEKTSFDVNVSQRSNDENPFQRVMRTRIDRLTWNC
jgi:hypothetical protein